MPTFYPIFTVQVWIWIRIPNTDKFPDPQHCLQVVPRKLPVSSNNTFTETVGVPLVTTDSTLSPAHGTSHQPSAGWIGSHLPGITVVRLTAHLTSRQRDEWAHIKQVSEQ